MSKSYGIPYMGSKQKIASQICKAFPKAKHFYDLFGGGFSITHCMLETRAKDYQHFHFNEIRKGFPQLVKDAIEGKYNYSVFKPEWISRERFSKEKEENPYIKICWSFGNNGIRYLFGEDIEPYKKSMHNAIVFNQFDQRAKDILGMEAFKESYSINARRLFLRNRIVYLNEKGVLRQDGTILNRGDLEQLQRLERLERLEQLEQLQRLLFYNSDYQEIKIEPDSIIYCDIPYHGTGEYDKNKSFDHSQFFTWVQKQTVPVFVSEYNISKPFMHLVWQIEVRSTLSATNNNCKKIEKLYCNKLGLDALKLKFNK